MEIGITLDGPDLVTRARFAELGFESVWLPDLQLWPAGFQAGRPERSWR